MALAITQASPKDDVNIHDYAQIAPKLALLDDISKLRIYSTKALNENDMPLTNIHIHLI
jgi:hypothetical protein